MKNSILTYLIPLLALMLCSDLPKEKEIGSQLSLDVTHKTEVIVLGIAQDAGYPQAGCQKSCCQKIYDKILSPKLVSCIAAVDHEARKYWIVDATPDFPEQLRILNLKYPGYQLDGIFLTHAHVGHYTGLMHLGREIMGSNQIRVYAMPVMKAFLEENGPWSQLVTLKNISIQELNSEVAVWLTKNVKITPIQVPHRDEFSETVGYYIEGTSKQVLFIPDIDKWEKWNRNIITEIQSVDIALIDGSFYANGEIPGRDMSQIPHPFLEESMKLFSQMDSSDLSKVGFIHFNHTNPVLDNRSKAYQTVHKTGMWIAEENQVIPLD